MDIGYWAVHRRGAALAALFGMLALAPPSASLAAQRASAAPTAEAEVLGLPDVVRRALERNREIRQARYTLDEAEGQVSEAWSGIYPTVDFSANYVRNLSPAVSFIPAIFFDDNASPGEFAPVQFSADNIWSTSVDVDQTLFDARSFIGVGAAGRYRELQDEVLRARIASVATAVRLRYYELLLAQEQQRLTDHSLRRVRESLAQAKAQYRAGLVSEYDVLRLEVELANLEPNLRRALNAVVQARRQLAVELDLDEAETLRVAGSLAEMDLADPGANSADNRTILEFGGVNPAVDPSELVAAALASRSDLRQLELTEDLRRTELRLEQVEYFPTVNVFGSYTINAQQNGRPDFFGSIRAYGRTIGVRVSLPVFNGFQRESRIDQRRAALRAAQGQTRLAADQAAADVLTLAEQVEEALLRSRGQELAVRWARRGFEIASAQHREGLSSQLEVTDAEVALRQSEFNYAQAVFDYLTARARLDEAVGRVPFVDGGLR